MANKDYIPRKDGKFLEWVQKLIIYAELHLLAWGISKEIFEPIQTLFGVYSDAYSKAQDPNRGKVDVLEKDEARDSLKTVIRQFVKEHLQYNSLVTNGDRESMGLPIHDTKPTPPRIPTEMPIGEIDFSIHLRHIITVKDGKLTGRRKPPQVHGFEVWHKVGGAPPVDDSEWSYVNFSTRSPLIVDYPLSDVGKTVYYRFRWVNSRNQPGPWNETIIIAVIA
ncbi:MAG: hypothetical protein LBF85_00070 [Tannerella sp.]|jgi:hypothetical protein|nr:hypothetical protein [Tannerella sp.]